MTRFLVALSAAVVLGATAQAGGPPPMYVVVDKVTVESSGGPERITIRGSFIRLNDREEYKYGKPVEGFVCLSLDEKKAAECRAEWKRWAQAAGTGKAVAIGICGEGGAMLKVTIRGPAEKATGPDATYTVGHLDNFDPPGKGWSDQKPVKELLAFVKDRRAARPGR
jgi:hypothetical protein